MSAMHTHALLLSLPSPALQVVIQNLSSSDVANLRLVSTAVSTHTTQCTHSINLRLSGSAASRIEPSSLASSSSSSSASSSSNIKQLLQSWRTATRNLDHVPSIHVLISGNLSMQDWTDAVEALAARGNVKHIHVLAAPISSIHTEDNSRSNGAFPLAATTIPSLAPLQQLLPGLSTLTVKGVTVTTDLTHNIRQLIQGLPGMGSASPFTSGSVSLSEAGTVLMAPAAAPSAAVATVGSTPAAAAAAAVVGAAQLAASFNTAAAAAAEGSYQLQSLELGCSWAPSGVIRDLEAFTAVMQQLHLAFPRLNSLSLQLPAIVPSLHRAFPPSGQADGAAAAGGPRVRQVLQMQAAALAALAIAAAKMQHLRHLTFSKMPDIWAEAASGGPGIAEAAAEAAAAAAAGGGGRLPRQALHSLDDLGCWLLEQLPHLSSLQLGALGGSCSMTWQRSISSNMTTCSPSNIRDVSIAAPAAAAAVPSIRICYHAGQSAARAAAAAYHAGLLAATAAAAEAPGTASTGSSNSSDSSSRPSQVLPELRKRLSIYSHRPAELLLPHITSLQAVLIPEQMDAAASALKALPSLTDLRLTFLTTSSRTSDFSGLVTAAAAATGLTSLVLLPGFAKVDLDPLALLPLTGAAGGPGSSLKHLAIMGNFSSSCSSSSSQCCVNQQALPDAAAESASPTAPAPAAAAAVLPSSPWSLLTTLDGLTELKIHQVGPNLLPFPDECLPKTLRAFDGKKVHLLTTAPTAACAHHHHHHSSSSSNNSSTAVDICSCGSQSCRPNLQALRLQDCKLDAVAGLASCCMQQCTVERVSWPGGWSAAAAAWPALQSLSAWCPQPGKKFYNSSSSSNARRMRGGCLSAEPAAVAGAGAAEVESSGDLLHELSHFKCLQELELQRLTCLSPRVLHIALHHMPQLRRLGLSAAAMSGLPTLLLRTDGPSAAADSRSGCTLHCDGASFCGLQQQLGEIPDVGVIPAVEVGSADVASSASGGGCLRHVRVHLPNSRLAATPVAGLFGQHLQQAEVQAGTMAVGPGAVAAAASGDSGGGGGGSGGNSLTGCTSPAVSAAALQRVLQQSLPWCNVAVVDCLFALKA